MSDICQECGYAIGSMACEHDDTLLNGAWVAYNHHSGVYVLSIHADKLGALRAAVGGTGYVIFLPWGDDFGRTVYDHDRRPAPTTDVPAGSATTNTQPHHQQGAAPA